MNLISFQLLFTLNSAIYALIIGLIVWRTLRIIRSIYHFRPMVIRVRIAVQYTGEWNKRNNASFWKTLLYALNYKALIVAKMFSNGSFIIFLNYFPIGRACIKKISNAHSFLCPGSIGLNNVIKHKNGWNIIIFNFCFFFY